MVKFIKKHNDFISKLGILALTIALIMCIRLESFINKRVSMTNMQANIVASIAIGAAVIVVLWLICAYIVNRDEDKKEEKK